jgi:hypothetical protein
MSAPLGLALILYHDVDVSVRGTKPQCTNEYSIVVEMAYMSGRHQTNAVIIYFVDI